MSLGADRNEPQRRPATTAEAITEFSGPDLHDLCDAAEAAIADGGGFGWLKAPQRHVMETYWKGVLLVPERDLFVARLDQTIAGSAQLVRPPRYNEAQATVGQLTPSFIAPWARGHGLARRLVEEAEREAVKEGFAVINLDVRETMESAIQLYESLGYIRIGMHPYYVKIDNEVLKGYYYYKVIDPKAVEQEP